MNSLGSLLDRKFAINVRAISWQRALPSQVLGVASALFPREAADFAVDHQLPLLGEAQTCRVIHLGLHWHDGK